MDSIAPRQTPVFGHTGARVRLFVNSGTTVSHETRVLRRETVSVASWRTVGARAKSVSTSCGRVPPNVKKKVDVAFKQNV